MPTEVSHIEKDKYHDITYMWDLKYDTDKLIYETETDSQTENILVVTKEERGERRDNIRVWD